VRPASSSNIVGRGFEPNEVGRVATIFLDALLRKVGGFLGDRKTAHVLTCESLDPDWVLTARSDDGSRRQGTGGRLTKAVETFAREHNYQMVSLDVVDTNPRAHKLYKRHGFSLKKTTRAPFLRRFMSFTCFNTMIKPVAAPIN